MSSKTFKLKRDYTDGLITVCKGVVVKSIQSKLGIFEGYAQIRNIYIKLRILVGDVADMLEEV